MWDKPKEVSNLDMGFGPTHLSDYLPAWNDIPEDFKLERGVARQWTDFVSNWFFNGIQITDIMLKEGVDRSKAMRHLKAIMGSYEPSHEHKTAGVAYLASLWFNDVRYVKAVKAGR